MSSKKFKIPDNADDICIQNEQAFYHVGSVKTMIGDRGAKTVNFTPRTKTKTTNSVLVLTY